MSTERFRTPARPLAPEASVITGDGWRVTVLTNRLLRLERNTGGTFEDRPTQIVLNRDFPTPDFTVTRRGKGVTLRTDAVILDYDGGDFWPGGLQVRLIAGRSWHQQWRYGEEPRDWTFPLNLGGTARTLDGVDGPTPLEPGLGSTTGIAPLPDASLALTDDGWFAPHAPGDDLYVFAYGTDFDACLRDYYALTGPTPLLPRHALGNWWSRYHRYDEAEYLALLDRIETERLPFAVAVIDMDWHLTDIPERFGLSWTGYTWNRDLFPDPAAFLAELHRRGLRVTLNVHPAEGVRAFEDAYPAIAASLGLDADAEQPASFDIGDPAFAEAYLDDVHHPLEADGVDFWWIDWQQGAWSATPGLDPLWALNQFHFQDNARTGRRPLILSRYAGPGSHRYPVGFSGDAVVSWASLDFQPYFTATAANIGYGWWSHDIGGHIWGYSDAELTARWFWFGAFSPIMRLHSTNNAFTSKEPWNFPAPYSDAMGEALRTRHRLLPYLYTMNERAHRLGQPLCRPLYYRDPRVVDASRGVEFGSKNTYLFGSEMLVAPITQPADAASHLGVVETWLPAGEWVDLFTGVRYAGGRTLRLHRGLDSIPVLAKAGAIVPLQPWDAGVANPDALELVVVPGADGAFELYEDDDALEPRAVRTPITWSDADRTLTIGAASGELDVVPATRRITVRFLGAPDPDGSTATGGVPDAAYDRATASLTFELGEVSTAEGRTVTVPAARPGGNDELERIRRFLRQADWDNLPKQVLLADLAAEPTFARRLMVLEGFAVPDAIRGPLVELLLARPEG